MTDTTDTTTAETADEVLIGADENPEGGISDVTPEGSDLESDQDDDPETFPREVVKDLRKENAKYRARAQQADVLAQRLHTELIRATGRLADPSDLEFNEDHLADPEKLIGAIDDLLDRKPHLATRKPAGDIGQGNRGGAPQPVSLLQILKDAT